MCTLRKRVAGARARGTCVSHKTSATSFNITHKIKEVGLLYLSNSTYYIVTPIEMLGELLHCTMSLFTMHNKARRFHLSAFYLCGNG